MTAAALDGRSAGVAARVGSLWTVEVGVRMSGGGTGTGVLRALQPASTRTINAADSQPQNRDKVIARLPAKLVHEDGYETTRVPRSPAASLLGVTSLALVKV